MKTGWNADNVFMFTGAGTLKGDGMDVLCVLMRSSEFEFDSHRLRRCRRRLRDQHRELLKMVRQQRHWERRCLDREARNPWQTSFDPSPQTPGD